MDTYLHACRREVNQNPVTMPGLKQRLVVCVCLGPKIASEAISRHPKFKNFPGGAYPQPPQLVHTRANVRTWVQVPIGRTNANLLPPGLLFNLYKVANFYFILVSDL